jgi:hypothetical protein
MLLVAAETSGEASRLIPTWQERRQVCDQLKGLTLASIQTVAPLGNLDDVAALIHLATVAEVDDQSRFWFDTACVLAKGLGLGHELPSSAAPNDQSMDGSEYTAHASTEEVREERRRVWWLLYMVDCVFGLYENRQPTMLDHDLLQPMDDAEYQNGDFQSCPERRIRGPAFECTGHSIYTHLLPLMAILGEILAQRHGSTTDHEISDHLGLYMGSLRRMRGEAPYTGTLQSDTSTQLAIAYGTYMARVLEILWTEDGEIGLVASRPGADVASALEGISYILDLDPNLKFIQFFFGIFLFRGLLPLLQCADEQQINRPLDLGKLGGIVARFEIHYRVSFALYYATTPANSLVSGMPYAWLYTALITVVIP